MFFYPIGRTVPGNTFSLSGLCFLVAQLYWAALKTSVPSKDEDAKNVES